MLDEHSVTLAVIGGVFAGIFGNFLRVWRDRAEEQNFTDSKKLRRLGSENLRQIIRARGFLTKLLLGGLVGGLYGATYFLQFNYAREYFLIVHQLTYPGKDFLILHLIAAAAASYVATDLTRFLERSSEVFFATPNEEKATMANISIPVKFTTKFKSGEAAACSVWIENLSGVLVTETQVTYIEIPEEMLYSENGLRVRFEVKFPKGRAIGALAKVWRPTDIYLEQSDYKSVTGTIHANSAKNLSAAATVRGCDVTCIPPAEQKSGPASCVVCQDQDGTFELCC